MRGVLGADTAAFSLVLRAGGAREAEARTQRTLRCHLRADRLAIAWVSRAKWECPARRPPRWQGENRGRTATSCSPPPTSGPDRYRGFALGSATMQVPTRWRHRDLHPARSGTGISVGPGWSDHSARSRCHKAASAPTGPDEFSGPVVAVAEFVEQVGAVGCHQQERELRRVGWRVRGVGDESFEQPTWAQERSVQLGGHLGVRSPGGVDPREAFSSDETLCDTMSQSE